MAETAAQDASIGIEPSSGRSTPCGEEPERYNAALRAMIMSDAMGAYDLLEHQMTLWEISVAKRGIASQTALVALRARLSGARQLEARHGPGCLLKLDDPFLRTFVEKFHLRISDLHVRAAGKFGREHPHLLRAWTEAAPSALAHRPELEFGGDCCPTPRQ